MVSLSHLQISDVAFLPVVHEDKIQPFQTKVRPQPRDYLIRWIHNELHLENTAKDVSKVQIHLINNMLTRNVSDLFKANNADDPLVAYFRPFSRV